MIEREMRNQVKNLLDNVSDLRQSFERLSLDGRQEFLIFLSRIVSLLDYKPIEKEIVTLLSKRLKTEAITEAKR